MRDLVEKLGKPKSWWITMGCAVAALAFGMIALGIYWLGVTAHIRASIYALGAMWLAGVLSMLVYYVGQFSGRYKDLRGRKWSDLPW